MQFEIKIIKYSLFQYDTFLYPLEKNFGLRKKKSRNVFFYVNCFNSSWTNYSKKLFSSNNNLVNLKYVHFYYYWKNVSENMHEPYSHLNKVNYVPT